MGLLTKSLYLKGRQCARRLWLLCNGHEEPALESEALRRDRDAEAGRVERLAERLFPGGERAAPRAGEEEPRSGPLEGIERTRTLVAAGATVFQAWLRAGELLAIADVLERRPRGWFLWEIKASTKASALHDHDLAFQVEVARRAGLEVLGAGLVLLADDFERGEHEPDPARLFVRVDRSAQVFALGEDVRRAIATQEEALAGTLVPQARPGARCKENRDAAAGDRPSACGHLSAEGYCGRDLPLHWAGRLPRLRGATLRYVEALEEPTVLRLDPQDPAAGWSPEQARMIRAVRAGAPEIDALALRYQLSRLEWPVAYLDFEFDPGRAIPPFPGSRPYDRLPFQWSMHVQEGFGAEPVERAPFLHLDAGDPRAPFLESLLDALPPAGSVVVHYRPAEKGVLEQLAERLGGDAATGARAVARRLYDTLDLAKSGYYHPDQQGSYSIKKLAPAMLGRGYGDLALQDGMAAVVAWRRATAPDCPAEERERLRGELLAYCGRDTLLMHGIVEHVHGLVEGRAPRA